MAGTLTARDLHKAHGAATILAGVSVTVAPGDVLGVVVPSVWEICETVPRPGARVRQSARLRAALPGTCDFG